MADTYSVVDLSRKKKNRSLQENNAGLEPGTYSVLEQRNFDSEGQDSPQAVTTDAFSNAVYEMPSSSTCDAEGTYIITASAASNEKKKSKEFADGKQTRKCTFCVIATAVVLLLFALAIFACLAILFAEVSKLKSETSLSLEQEQTTSNEQPNEALYDQLSYLNESFSVYKVVMDQQLRQINFNITEHHEHQSSTAQMLSSLLQASLSNISTLESQIANLETNIFGQFQQLPASCAALPPSSPSGYYWVRASNGSAVRVYCDMTRSCGGVTGGWMRVAELDMTKYAHQCPSGFRADIRACVKNEDDPHCSSVIYSTLNIHTYSRVCGRVIAYQYGTTDAFRSYSTRNISIDGSYVDGVSLTHGHNSRQHIWTFAAAYSENTHHTLSNCCCFDDSAPNSPWFVGNDYFCDTGAINDAHEGTPYSNDPLWDGAGCESPNTCCTFNTPPWFHKQLPRHTTDDIEMRVCRDEPPTNEDIAIQIVELYVHQ